MASLLHTLDQRRLIDSDGIADSADVYFYLSGTTTPAPIYADSGLTTPLANPVEVPAGGALSNIWLNSEVIYRRRIVYRDGTIDDVDPYYPYLTSEGGLSLLSFKRPEPQTYSRSLEQMERMGMFDERGVSVAHWIPPSLDEDLLDGTNSVNLQPYIQNALTYGPDVLLLPPVRMVIESTYDNSAYDVDTLLAITKDNQTIIQQAGGYIEQLTNECGCFYAQNKTGLRFEDLDIRGPGYWDESWTTSGQHTERGLILRSCSDIVVKGGKFLNWGFAGIWLEGCTQVRIIEPYIEGSHVLGTPLVFTGNRQMGIYLTSNSVAGVVEDVQILSPRIRYVCQGILDEWDSGPHRTLPLQIVAPFISDVVGQHGFYLTMGGVSITQPVLQNIALAGLKLQHGNEVADMVGFDVTGLSGRDIGSNFIEIRSNSSKKIRSGVITGALGRDVGRGVSIIDNIEAFDIDLNVEGCNRTDAPFNTGVAVTSGDCVMIGGSSVKDVNIRFNGYEIRENGVLVYGQDHEDIKISPTIRNPALGSGSFSGIEIRSDNSTVTITDPDVHDANDDMTYGLFVSSASAVVFVEGSRARFEGASDVAIRATGEIRELPSELLLSGANGNVLSWATIKSSKPLLIRARTTTGTNAPLWGRTMPDNTTLRVVAHIAGKLADGSQQKGVTSTATFYRDGGNATLVAAATESAAHSSGSFAGAYSFVVSGTSCYLVANSGGSADYDWTVHIITIET